MKSITVEVDKKGICTVEAHGFLGASCTDVTGPLTKALGHVEDEGLKASYTAKEIEQVKVNAK